MTRTTEVKMKPTHKAALAICLAALAALFCGSALAYDFKVYVEPIEVFNSGEIKELAPGLRTMVGSRISGQNYKVTADSGESATSDFSLRTTITKLSGIISVDAELTSRTPGVDGARAYETVTGMEGLMKALEKVTERIKSRLEQAKDSITQAKAQPLSPPLDRHPPGWKPGVTPPAVSVPPAPAAPAIEAPKAEQAKPAPATAKTVGEQLAAYKELATINGEAVSIATGDVDGDGIYEVLVVNGKNLSVYKETEDSLAPLWSGETDLSFKPLAITAGDADGDGKVEFFIAGKNDSDVYTQGYVFKGGKPEKKGLRAYAFMRAVTHPSKGPMLIGLKSLGGQEVFSPALRTFTWSGNEYVPGPEIEAPRLVSLLNAGWVKFQDKAVSMMLLDGENRLRIYGETQEKLFTTDEPIGGASTRIEGEIKDPRNMEPGSLWEVNSLPVPFTGADGLTYALMTDNKIGALVSTRWNILENGRLLAVRWDGNALHTGGQTPKFQGYFSAIAGGGTTKAGARKIYAVLVKTKGFLFKEYTSQVLRFEL